ncbi:hypothetical protein DY000_02058500 [Brassica cretica]|uniref:Uncharacterized protein n=1 Tax=Brassica cretica TaxID=69181 RepID=A0ABQ7AP38_BRACR|nr:hypothetical protein DY000_02058500 [Brassica cretica]
MFDIIVFPSARRRVDGGAVSSEVPWKVPLPNRSTTLFSRGVLSCFLSSLLLILDGLLHLQHLLLLSLHLLLNDCQCSSEVILIAVITHVGVGCSRLLTVLSF